MWMRVGLPIQRIQPPFHSNNQYQCLDPPAPGAIPSAPQRFSEENVDVAEVIQQRCLEESGQWLENPSGTCQWQVSTTKTISTECSNPNFEVFVEFKVILFCS